MHKTSKHFCIQQNCIVIKLSEWHHTSQMDPAYEPSDMETRTIFGVCLQQKRNTVTIDKTLLENVVSENKHVRTVL